MKFTHFTLAAFASCGLFYQAATAQDARQSRPVKSAAFDYYYLDDESQASPSDAPAPPAAGGGAATKGTTHVVQGDDCGCDDACDDGCGSGPFGLGFFDQSCCLGDAWTLFPNDNCRGVTVGGHLQFGYHTEGANQGEAPGFGNFAQGGNGLFNDYPNRVQLHQAWVTIERAADADCDCWDWGFRADYVYGTDGPNTQAFGALPNDWDNTWDHGFAYGHAIPQLYAEVAYGDLKIKGGHFFTIVGYEVVPATGNFFYSHTLSMNLAEPFTHTGVLAEFAWNEAVTVYGGWSAGWDTAFSSNGGDIFLGGITLQMTEDMSLAYAATGGDFGNGGGQDGYSHSLVLDWQVTDRVQTVLQSDLVSNPTFVRGQGRGDIISFISNTFYTINDCWKVGLRNEWFDHDGLADEINVTTLGLNYKPHANVVLRPEVRVDNFHKNFAPTISDSTMFGLDAIVTY